MSAVRSERTMLVHVGLNLVVEIFHDALERFGDPALRPDASSIWRRALLASAGPVSRIRRLHCKRTGYLKSVAGKGQ
jgi:hypothetical protein